MRDNLRSVLILISKASMLVCLIVESGLPQAGGGSVDGFVLDPGGSVIPHARIKILREETGDERATFSNEDGFFSVDALLAGSYTLEVESAGFRKLINKGIVVHPGDRVKLRRIILEVGPLNQEIQVRAASEGTIPVDTGEKASVVTSSQIQNLSIIGRNAMELLKILPGTVNTGGDTGEIVSFLSGVGSYSVAGTREESLSLISDGASVAHPRCNCGSAVTPNVDLIQEFKLQTASFSAENAKGPVVVTTVSKWGTREFHGETYLYARDYLFNSKDWLANRYGFAKPHDSYYYPGFNIGGPLLIPGIQFNKNRDKLFFFAGFESMRQNVDLGVVRAVVPTAKMRQGNFSELNNGLVLSELGVQGLPNVDGSGPTSTVDPSLFDKGGQVLINLLPLPNRDPNTNDGFNYYSNIVNPQNRTQTLVRLDYSISDNTKLYTRLNYETETTPYPYQLWSGSLNGAIDIVPYPSRVIGANYSFSNSSSLTQVLNPSTTHEIVFAATHIDLPNRFEDPAKVSRKALGYPYQGIYRNGVDQIPDLVGDGIPLMGQPAGFSPEIFIRNWLFNVGDNFAKIKNTHTFKLGGFFQFTSDVGPTILPDQGALYFSTYSGNTTGNTYADLLLGRFYTYQESTKTVVTQTWQREFAFYAQDNWKATQRLTLELGARFHHIGRFYDRHGYFSGFDSKKYDPKAPIDAFSGLVAGYRGDDIPKSVFVTPVLRVGPRFGFAYDLTSKGNTVLRGGFGSFLYGDPGGYSLTGALNPPLQQSTFLIDPGVTLGEIDHIESEVIKPEIYVNDISDDRIPITYSWNLMLSKQIFRGTILETSYVGNSSHNQLTPEHNINAVPEGAMFGYPKGRNSGVYRPYQNYSRILLRSHLLTQNYNSLMVTLNRYVGPVNIHGSYTFSKSLGTAGRAVGSFSPFDFRGRSYGVLRSDRTQIFTIAYNIFLPSHFQTRGLQQLLNGWQISGITQIQSGSPIGFYVSGTMENGQYIFPTSVTGSPDDSANPWLKCDPRQGLEKGQYANPGCFAAPLPGINGPYQIPYVKGPYFQNHDLSVFKNFILDPNHETRRLQFRFSAYNFLNHPNPILEGYDPGLILNFTDGVLGQDSMERFGRVTQKRGRRVIQFAVKVMF